MAFFDNNHVFGYSANILIFYVSKNLIFSLFLAKKEDSGCLNAMGLPGHRRTSSHKRRRAAHFALKPLMLAPCPKCKEPALPHRACPSCGTYAGRQVLTLKDPLQKKNLK